MLGTPPELAQTTEERVAQRALEGFTRSLGKEIGRGSTVQLVYVAPGAEDAMASTLGFLLSPKSAYVSGQVVRIGTTSTADGVEVAQGEVVDPDKPLAGKVALVTGASRGIGEQIARVLHRDGATVLGVDVPQMASELQALARELDGDHLVLDITAVDAPQRIAQHVREAHGGVDVVVHNAGITRDKKLANMKPDRWDSVIAVNLTAPERITAQLLEEKLVRDNGSIVGVASIAGIAGNVGQTNYAASKAGVIGLVDALAPTLERRDHRQRRGAGLHRDPDDRCGAAHDPRGRPPPERPEPGRPPGRRRRDHRLVRPPRLDGRERERRAGLRPDDAGRLMSTGSQPREKREVDGGPGGVGTLVRAALPALPVVSALPGVRRTATELPAWSLFRSGVTVERAHAETYAQVCGFPVKDTVPLPYPHLLAFGLHMALMTDRAFPYPAIGTVHLENSITAHRPVAVGESLDVTAYATNARPHPKGTVYDMVSEVREHGSAASGDLVWEETSTFLRVGRGDHDAPASALGGLVAVDAQGPLWRLPADLGRRYAAVSGDSNPIHLYALTAKAFGFPRQIAHGMWTMARSVAALENRLPDAVRVDVSFRKPVLLPGSVRFGAQQREDGAWDFGLTRPGSDAGSAPHLLGRATPA